jgi:hypothetical protein
MLVGLTQAGKSECWKILLAAMNKLNAEEKAANVKPQDYKFQSVDETVINPKSINLDELYGALDDQNPPQWQDGILSNVLKKMCQEKVEG